MRSGRGEAAPRGIRVGGGVIGDATVSGDAIPIGVGAARGKSVPGGSVGSGCGVGTEGNGGPGYTIGCPGVTMCGVTLMISSLLLPFSVSLRNARPMSGKSPNSGIFDSVRGVYQLF